MSVRAKFRLIRTESQIYDRAVKQADGNYEKETVEQRTLIFQPVYSDNPANENKTFWEATPSGEIKLGVVNRAAWEQFDLNAEYYVTFDRAPS